MQRKITDQEALDYHKHGQPGKLEVKATKPMLSQEDLSLAYSPGVAVPCLEIAKDPEAAYDYTAKGNMVAVISNGTAVLGLGDIGALASKPVMEGKSVLFKRFADINSFDIEVDTKDIDKFVNAVQCIAPTFGGINLEDIKAPECFIIEDRLKELLNIPVFHDDQHGTAIITLAGMINACKLNNRKLEDLKFVVNGAGAAGIACIELIKAMGAKHDEVILCDTKGVIYKGRTEGMNQWKSAHAADTKARTLAEALVGADVFLGLSAKGAVTAEMVKTMADKPIIFAMANPNPEITPEEVYAVRSDAIVATGRSDYKNQVNNVMGFPYIFRGALDVRATTINEEMKIAAANALAELARQPVPDEVSRAYAGRKMQFGPEYIIPVPFDPRLITTIPVAVAKAAMETGVAKKPIENFEVYRQSLRARLDPAASNMNLIFNVIANNPKKIIFAEGEEEPIIRAAITWVNNGYGQAILVGREARVKERLLEMQVELPVGIEITNAFIQSDEKLDVYIDYMYAKLQRQGYLHRDCARLVKNDRNIFAACMLAMGQGDALVSGITRGYTQTLDTIKTIIDTKPEQLLAGVSVVINKGKAIFITDTTVHALPTAEELARITTQTANFVRKFGQEPRVALLSFTNFGNPQNSEKAERIRETVRLLEEQKVDFEFDGEMSADVALNSDLLKLYPFCKLKGPANVLVMPALHSANISSKLMQEIGGCTVIGPLLLGLSKPVQITQYGSTTSEILNICAFAALQANEG
ncbi:NADP-dependent malic enzyme [Rickettsiales endosymbiont of Stachyamoeba lipophora]|nr:NADP-dependent malic enzyme [Rickettsiales endosymbiont of Stachyamoeba lipophora]AZL15983.1 NADP-dependent malic enzyme [Rickettsiales endosymbiont of Stachyamoeba lipophora]